MSPSKLKRRLGKLSKLIEKNDVRKLELSLQKRKYLELPLREAGINKRKETLLHHACRLCRPQAVRLLIQHALADPSVVDLKGNTALHLALKAVMKIDQKDAFVSGIFLYTVLVLFL